MHYARVTSAAQLDDHWQDPGVIVTVTVAARRPGASHHHSDSEFKFERRRGILSTTTVREQLPGNITRAPACYAVMQILTLADAACTFAAAQAATSWHSESYATWAYGQLAFGNEVSALYKPVQVRLQIRKQTTLMP